MLDNEDGQRKILLVIVYLLVFIFTGGIEGNVSVTGPIIVP